jgi:hypothetical protein
MRRASNRESRSAWIERAIVAELNRKPARNRADG